MLSSFGLVTVIDVLLAMLVTFVLFPPLIIYMDSHRGKEKEILGKIPGKFIGKKQISESVNF